MTLAQLRLLFLIPIILAAMTEVVSKTPGDPMDFECPKPSGYFADPAACDQFYNCQGGRAYKMTCPSGLFFDESGKVCEYRDEVECGPSSE